MDWMFKDLIERGKMRNVCANCVRLKENNVGQLMISSRLRILFFAGSLISAR